MGCIISDGCKVKYTGIYPVDCWQHLLDEFKSSVGCPRKIFDIKFLLACLLEFFFLNCKNSFVVHQISRGYFWGRGIDEGDRGRMGGDGEGRRRGKGRRKAKEHSKKKKKKTAAIAANFSSFFSPSLSQMFIVKNFPLFFFFFAICLKLLLILFNSKNFFFLNFFSLT